MAVISTNPTRLVNGVRALGINDIKPGLTIAAFTDIAWQTLEVMSISYRLDPTDSWWATMTNLASDSRNETLPRNLANLGVVQDPNGDWALGRVAIIADDLPLVERAGWSYDTPFLPFLF